MGGKFHLKLNIGGRLIAQLRSKSSKGRLDKGGFENNFLFFLTSPSTMESYLMEIGLKAW